MNFTWNQKAPFDEESSFDFAHPISRLMLSYDGWPVTIDMSCLPQSDVFHWLRLAGRSKQLLVGILVLVQIPCLPCMCVCVCVCGSLKDKLLSQPQHLTKRKLLGTVAGALACSLWVDNLMPWS